MSLVDMTANRDTAILLHYIFVFLLPPYPVFGALYYVDTVSIIIKYCNNELMKLSSVYAKVKIQQIKSFSCALVTKKTKTKTKP